MQNLYNSLIQGTVTYEDNGKVVAHPPTATMLRAARAIQALSGENANTHAAIMAAQVRESGLLADIDAMRKELEQLRTLIKENSNDQSLCDGRKEASDVGSRGGDLFGSDSGSPESDATTNSSPSLG